MTWLLHTPFSAGNNVRFLDGKAGKILGHIQVLGAPGSSNNPLLGCKLVTGYYRPSFGSMVQLQDYGRYRTTHADVTRSSGAYTTIASTTNNWQGGILGGVLVCCYGIDALLKSFTQGGSVFTDLAQWPQH